MIAWATPMALAMLVGQAIAEKDGELLGRTAHALKGRARNFQADDAAEAALKLEQLARDGAFDQAETVGRSMTAALRQFEMRLQQMIDRLDD